MILNNSLLWFSLMLNLNIILFHILFSPMCVRLNHKEYLGWFMLSSNLFYFLHYPPLEKYMMTQVFHWLVTFMSIYSLILFIYLFFVPFMTFLFNKHILNFFHMLDSELYRKLCIKLNKILSLLWAYSLLKVVIDFYFQMLTASIS